MNTSHKLREARSSRTSLQQNPSSELVDETTKATTFILERKRIKRNVENIEHVGLSEKNHPENLSEAIRETPKILEKLKAAEPYNMFLSTIKDSPATHNEMLSIQLQELLDPSLGDLESSLQCTFLVELDWLLDNYNRMGHQGKPMTLLCGELEEEDLDSYKHFITHAKVEKRSLRGIHHTKMMILAYRDGSIRVVISTANLLKYEWENVAQGLWVSPLCPSLPADSTKRDGDSPTCFKKDLLFYLSYAYKLPQLRPWIEKVEKADFSAVNVFFIASVPGWHRDDENFWGHLALAKILDEAVKVPASYKLIIQCSSIGGFGPKPEAWFMGEMLSTFCSGREYKPDVDWPQVKLIYPTHENVVQSHDGPLKAECLSYARGSHIHQVWLNKMLCQWKSDSRNRSKASPHIKSYCRVSPDNSKLSYFLLTSANMSKNAWGRFTPDDKGIRVYNHEAGVLFAPQYIVGKDYFPLKKDGSDDIPLFPMPYDLPLTPYTSNDVPWFIENLPSQQVVT